MILKKISCEQFAGLKNREMNLDEHMNVIIGSNESGKTTMLEMAYHVLNTSVDLKRNEKKDFFETYMPAEKETGFTGDNIDGAVTFESSDGVFTIQKEWMKEENGNCKLTAEDGTNVKSRNAVQKKMRDELEFGQAVYRNLIFSSQKDGERVVKGILQAADDSGMKEAKSELASRFTQAVMELDGVSIDALGEEIEKKITEYESNWDSQTNRPKSKSKSSGGRWEKNIGKILESYYIMEDIARAMDAAQKAEDAYEKAGREAADAKEAATSAEREANEFEKYVWDISSRKQNLELTQKHEKEREEYIQALSDWPGYQKQQKKLLLLREELAAAKRAHSVTERYARLSQYEKILDSLRERLKKTGNIAKKDYERAVFSQREQERLKASMDGLSGLQGKLEIQRDFIVNITQGADARSVPVEDGVFQVDEAFQISIPDVMDLQICPRDINMNDVLLEFSEHKEEQKSILLSYHTKNMQMLQEKYEAGQKLQSEIQAQEAALSAFLGEETRDGLLEEYKTISGELRDIHEICEDISQICNPDCVDEAIGRLNSKLEHLEEKYKSPENLNQILLQKEKRLEELQKELGQMQEIPEKYKKYADMERSSALRLFEENCKEAEVRKKEKEIQLIQCEKALPERTLEEIQPEYECAREEFEKNKELCSHWKHIFSVFQATKEGMKQNPASDIQENTKKYLEAVTGGAVTVQTGEDGLDMGVVSRGSRMNYGLLSEGTKQTISLAFRLAVLENLYGSRKGFAVFDDSLIDMDPERRRMAAQILKQFSEKHQVIYVTCDPQFGKLLGGKVSEWED